MSLQGPISSRIWRIFRGLAFVFLQVLVVGSYCQIMAGRLEPLKHQPDTFVGRPLMVLTAVVSAMLYPLLARRRSSLRRTALLYLGFVLIACLYGIFLGSQFPEVSLWGAIPLALVGAHLYGWPVFLLVLAIQALLGRWFFPSAPNGK